MFYLLKHSNDDIEIVSNCLSIHHKKVILQNYCINNDITLVANRQEINQKNRSNNQLFCYPIDNKFIIIDSTYHKSNILFNSYCEKYTVGYFSFKYYKCMSLPLTEVTIKKQEQKQVFS